MTEELGDEKRTWFLKGYAQAEADQEVLIKKLVKDISDLSEARNALLEDKSKFERQLKDAELLTSFPGGFYKTVKNVEETTWVERQVPEHMAEAVHDLITLLLKSHGYNSDGEKQDDNDT